jgi:LysM repeat protein
VVLACGMLLTLLNVVGVAGMRGSVLPAQANTRIARSITEITLTSTLSVAVAPTTATSTAPQYVVRQGDTLSGIAAALAVPGGWSALYAANRQAIGPDPDVIHPGTVLVLPGRPATVRYTVQAGDTLSGIAAALGVPGGWSALYAANRQAIGPDPNLIHPGTVLMVLRPPAPASPSSGPARPAQHAPAPRPVPAGGHRQRTAPGTTNNQGPAGMPQWLRIMLLTAGLLIVTAFLVDLVLVIARRRRQAVAGRGAPPGTHGLSQAPVPESGSGENVQKPRIVVADYHRLVVTHHKADDIVCVLRPPGEDPRAILRVARLVLAEDPYEELAERLGVPASWPMKLITE